MAEVRDRKDMLLEAGLTLASELSLPIVLQRIVDLAAQVTDARYGALGVIGDEGTLVEFVTTGIPARQRQAIGSLPSGRGVLGLLIHDPRPVRIKNIADHPLSVGFPANHPSMRSFLGAPVQAMGRVFGKIYLAEKRDAEEFAEEDEDALVVLATQAGVAIANATLYEEVRSRERWLDALRDITALVLGGARGTALLDSIAEHARDLARADAATIVTTTATPGQLVVSAAAGAKAKAVRGQAIPLEGSISGAVMRTGQGLIFDDVSQDPRVFQPMVALGGHGPAFFVPLRVPGGVAGTLTVANLRGGKRFSAETRRLVESLADAASVALDYDRVQAEVRRLGLLEERESGSPRSFTTGSSSRCSPSAWDCRARRSPPAAPRRPRGSSAPWRRSTLSSATSATTSSVSGRASWPTARSTRPCATLARRCRRGPASTSTSPSMPRWRPPCRRSRPTSCS